MVDNSQKYNLVASSGRHGSFCPGCTLCLPELSLEPRNIQVEYQSLKDRLLSAPGPKGLPTNIGKSTLEIVRYSRHTNHQCHILYMFPKSRLGPSNPGEGAEAPNDEEATRYYLSKKTGLYSHYRY